MSAPDIILKLSNIESYYGPIMAIRGISLEVPRGQIVSDGVAILARIGAHHQVLAHAQERKHLAPLRHMAQAEPHDLVGFHALDRHP